MKVFSIKGMFQPERRYSLKELKAKNYSDYLEYTSPVEFDGFFACEDSGQFKGYLIEHCSLQDVEKYIFGEYNEKQDKMVFLNLSTERQTPIIFAFPSVKYNSGYFSALSDYGIFFQFAHSDGFAKVTLSEVSKNPNEVLSVFNNVIEDGWEKNLSLIDRGLSTRRSSRNFDINVLHNF